MKNQTFPKGDIEFMMPDWLCVVNLSTSNFFIDIENSPWMDKGFKIEVFVIHYGLFVGRNEEIFIVIL